MENAEQIRQLTDKLIEARTDAAMAEACYIDAKAENFVKCASLSATAAAQQVSISTTEEKRALIMAECKLKNFQDQLNVLETANNNLKAALKLMEMEAKNLNLTW